MHLLVTVLLVSVLWLCPLMSKAGTGVSSDHLYGCGHPKPGSLGHV